MYVYWTCGRTFKAHSPQIQYYNIIIIVLCYNNNTNAAEALNATPSHTGRDREGQRDN